MLFINYILYFSSLLNNLSRRNIITLGSSNIMMKHYDLFDNNNNNNNNRYVNKIDKIDKEYIKFGYTIPNLNSDSDTKTIIHAEDNNLYFQGEISPESCFYLQQSLIKLQKQKNENNFINFYIQSSGGSLLPAFSIIDTIKSSTVPIHTHVNGYVASAGSLLSVSGHKRYITKNSMMLIHSLRTTIGEVNYQQLEDHYYNSETMMNIVKNIYKEKSNINNEYLEYLLQHDFWLNSTDCLKYKFVDEII